VSLVPTNPFPEQDYPPAPEHRERYEQLRARGRERASRSRLVITMLARDAAEVLERLTIPAAEAIGAQFLDYRVYVYENDSQDQTPQILENWVATNPRVFAECEDRKLKRWPATRDPRRGDFLAGLRNRCRDYIARYWPRFEYVLILDADIGLYSLDGILNSLGHDDWDAMGSNGLKLYHGRWVQTDAWAYRKRGDRRPLKCTEVHPILPQRGEPLLPVGSCFGGMGLYRAPAYLGARYKGGDCEHIAFHFAMSRVFLNPSQLVLYP
jgi:hypothetical protein